ncbi:hypothetical protein GMRT_13209 [Giardia muris]|uniref:Uncharacterized protein n=1 Tax=Giardia muris TaxID=5742 RepID=A0A4Z1SRY9_GIAMU|nr:hypothetical protein GMRT_13209 [Giardia muris]|eukprot:TNJ28682.1 hypothetical protein GMRT_13209 [Giardia muris]
MAVVADPTRVVRHLGKRPYVELKPVAGSLDQQPLAGLGFVPQDWHFIPMPNCAGHTQILRSTTSSVLSERQQAALQGMAFVYKANGELLTKFPILLEGHNPLIRAFHLRATSDLVIVTRDGRVRVFTLQGWVIREFKLPVEGKERITVLEAAGHENSLVALQSDGTFVVYNNLADTLTKARQLRYKTTRLEYLNNLFAGGMPKKTDVGFLAIIEANTPRSSPLICFSTSSVAESNPQLIVFPADKPDAYVKIRASEIVKKANSKLLTFDFANVVINASGDFILAADSNHSLAVLDISEFRKDEKTPPLVRLIIPGQASSSSAPSSDASEPPFIFGLCEALPAYYDPTEGCIRIHIPQSHGHLDFKTEEFDAQGVFMMQSLHSGLLYKTSERDEPITRHISRVSKALQAIRTPKAGKDNPGAFLFYSSTQVGESLVPLNQAIHLLDSQLPMALEQLLEAAKAALSIKEQRDILGTVSIGKLFIDDPLGKYTRQYDDIRRILHVANNFNGCDVGGAVPIEHYTACLTPTDLILYYVSCGLWDRAAKTCLYMSYDTAERLIILRQVLLRMALNYFLNPQMDTISEAAILQKIRVSFEALPAVKNAYRDLIDYLVYAKCYKRRSLIADLIQNEPIMADRIRLLISIQDYSTAIRQCLSYGAYDLAQCLYRYASRPSLAGPDGYLKQFESGIQLFGGLGREVLDGYLAALPYLAQQAKVSRSNLEKCISNTLLHEKLHASYYEWMLRRLCNAVLKQGSRSTLEKSLLLIGQMQERLTDDPFVSSVSRLSAIPTLIEGLTTAFEKGKVRTAYVPIFGSICLILQDATRQELEGWVKDATTHERQIPSASDSVTLADSKKVFASFLKKVTIDPSLHYMSACEGAIDAVKQAANNPNGREIAIQLLGLLNSYVRSIPGKTLSKLAYPLAKRLVEQITDVPLLNSSRLLETLEAVMRPVDLARFSILTTNKDKFATALKELSKGELEPFFISSPSLPPSLREAIAAL